MKRSDYGSCNFSLQMARQEDAGKELGYVEYDAPADGKKFQPALSKYYKFRYLRLKRYQNPKLFFEEYGIDLKDVQERIVEQIEDGQIVDAPYRMRICDRCKCKKPLKWDDCGGTVRDSFGKMLCFELKQRNVLPICAICNSSEKVSSNGDADYKVRDVICADLPTSIQIRRKRYRCSVHGDLYGRKLVERYGDKHITPRLAYALKEGKSDKDITDQYMAEGYGLNTETLDSILESLRKENEAFHARVELHNIIQEKFSIHIEPCYISGVNFNGTEYYAVCKIGINPSNGVREPWLIDLYEEAMVAELKAFTEEREGFMKHRLEKLMEMDEGYLNLFLYDYCAYFENRRNAWGSYFALKLSIILLWAMHSVNDNMSNGGNEGNEGDEEDEDDEYDPVLCHTFLGDAEYWIRREMESFNQEGMFGEALIDGLEEIETRLKEIEARLKEKKGAGSDCVQNVSDLLEEAFSVAEEASKYLAERDQWEAEHEILLGQYEIEEIFLKRQRNRKHG